MAFHYELPEQPQRRELGLSQAALDALAPNSIGAHRAEQLLGSVATDFLDTQANPVTPELALHESLLESFDTAYQTYYSFVETTNIHRGKVGGSILPAIDPGTIHTDTQALLSTPGLLQELQVQAYYFDANPEPGSPTVGFDLVIVPEGLSRGDQCAIASSLQAKIASLQEAFIRSSNFDDPRTLPVTGKGYSVAIAPRHYNMPRGTAAEQTSWMCIYNEDTAAVQLRTASDAEALAQINNLADIGELTNPDPRYRASYFRRFDQVPHSEYVSSVYAGNDGMFCLDLSFVDLAVSTRALVVGKI